MKQVLIIGGVAGGASTAARLRRLDEDCNIIMFERGEYISFANCGLPYYIGGVIQDGDDLTLQTPESFHARFNVDVRTFNEVVSIDRTKKEVLVKNLKTGETYTQAYDKLVLSPGAELIRPSLEGTDLANVFTLRNIPDTFAIRKHVTDNDVKSVVVVGGGYIGIEMAENLKHAGLDVTVVELQDQVIAPIDYDMACDVHRHIRDNGVQLLLKHSLQAIRKQGDGLQVVLDDRSLDADMVVLAIGVRPESKLAKDSAITTNEKGGIVVDSHMCTNDPDIYAIGDAVQVVNYITKETEMVPLAGPANKQGRIVADNLCGIASTYDGTQGSSILKVFDLTVAMTGINEKTAKRLGLDYDKSFTYSGSHAGYYPGAVNMSVKLIYEKKTGKILGAQIVGYDGCDKRCDVLATAIRFGATAEDLTKLECCYAPPYSSAKDPVNMAGYTVQNIVQGKVQTYQWHEVPELPRDGSVTLLDVRTELEYQNGCIDGFINIPLDDLRSRIGELDANKKVYATCQIGLRGYVACRILSQHGFDCTNLSGGYRLYASIFGQEAKEAATRIHPETQRQLPQKDKDITTILIDACGLQCPGPIVKLSKAIKEAKDGDVIQISTTDPAFASDLEGFCRRTGNKLLLSESSKGVAVARIEVGAKASVQTTNVQIPDGKNFIVFSGDLDKAIASFIMANAAAAMGREVSMFFTFWGLNILRKAKRVKVRKDFLSKMFGKMMPRGSEKLPLSQMNMCGMGPKMIRSVMKKKNISSLEELMGQARANGVKLIACSMSMDVMGIKEEELIDGVTVGGAAAMLAHAEESDMSLFI